MLELDILAIDANIRKNFEEEFEKLPTYKQKLKEIDETLTNNDLILRVKNNFGRARIELLKYIDELESREKFYLYIIQTTSYIEEYKKILNTPIKVSFLGKSTKDNKQKRELTYCYLEIASKYVDIELETNSKHDGVKCLNCSNKTDFDIIDNSVYICTKCYAKQIVMKHSSSYTDIDRVNISSKYMYDPKIHFRDCVKQYQGKQNCTIPPKIYEDLEKQFFLHSLLCESNIRTEMFKNITKNQIMIFLKDLGYSKHYENVHLIHYTFTGIKPDDITYLEDKLLDDFDSLIDLYHKRFKNIKRKNFINTQYVLYQLLCHYKHPCKQEEFIILKTIDRKNFHDEICKTLFEELGWNHTPFY